MWRLEGLPGVGGGSSSPPYLSQPFMVRISKFFCLVKACENPHWFLFHRQLSIVHHMAARRRQSDEGHSHQYFQGKSQILQFLCYINVIYLKRTHFSCRIQIQTKRVWFIIEKFEKIWIFVFGSKTRLTRCLQWLISQIFLQKNSKMAFLVIVKRFELTVVTRTNGMWKSTNQKTSCSALDTNDPKMIDTSFESPKCKL